METIQNKSFVNSYFLQNECNKILESGIYTGAVYAVILDFLNQIQSIDTTLKDIENKTPKNETSANRLERLYFNLLGKREKIAKEVHFYLLQNSSKYNQI